MEMTNNTARKWGTRVLGAGDSRAFGAALSARGQQISRVSSLERPITATHTGYLPLRTRPGVKMNNHLGAKPRFERQESHNVLEEAVPPLRQAPSLSASGLIRLRSSIRLPSINTSAWPVLGGQVVIYMIGRGIYPPLGLRPSDAFPMMR